MHPGGIEVRVIKSTSLGGVQERATAVDLVDTMHIGIGVKAKGMCGFPHELDLTSRVDNERFDEHADAGKHDCAEPSQFGLRTFRFKSAGTFVQVAIIRWQLKTFGEEDGVNFRTKRTMKRRVRCDSTSILHNM